MREDVAKDRNTRYHLYGTGTPCTCKYVSHTVYLPHEYSAGEARGRNKLQNNNKIGVINLERNLSNIVERGTNKV